MACEGIEAPEMKQDECESSCNAQTNLYEDEDDEEKQEAFQDLKSCIVSETCEDLTAGVCYDEDVFSW